MKDTKTFTIAIASGKGGTGKTFVSTHLAEAFRQHTPTLLVDLDVEEPNDKLFFTENLEHHSKRYKMVPEWNEEACTLCGDCTSNCKFHAVLQLGTMVAVFNELCHSCYACSDLCSTGALPMKPHLIGEMSYFEKTNLSFVESKLALTEEQAVPIINQGKKVIREEYAHRPVQLLDCPPGTSCPMVAATKDADFVILVTEPTAFGLNDLQLAVETMRQMNKAFAVLINRDGSGDNRVEKYCETENIHIIGKIAFDKNIAKHYAQGELVYDKLTNVKKEIDHIVEQVAERIKQYA